MAFSHFKIPSEPYGIRDSERCIEIPWAISLYAGEEVVLDIGYANAEERHIHALHSLKIPHLYGIDISEKKIDGFVTHRGDIRHTNFKDNFFDLVFCISTIEHVGRDNSLYSDNFPENTDRGDFEALKEIHRITNQEGKVILTAPFGKFFDYKWFIHYDENRLNALLCSCPFDIIFMDFFKYDGGWQKCDKTDLANTSYKDKNASAAAGLVCVLLKKKGAARQNSDKEITKRMDNKMDNNVVDNPDAKINVEDVVETIREKIQRRRAVGDVPDPNIPLASSVSETSAQYEESTRMDRIFINSNWDLHNNNYIITSHHPGIGKFLIKGRQLVHGEVRRYVDPLISRQTRLNASIVRILNSTVQKSVEFEQRCAGLDKHCTNLEQRCAGLEKHCTNLEQRYADLEKRCTNFEQQHADLIQRLKDLDDTLYAGQKNMDQKISRCIDMVDTAIEAKIDERIDHHLALMDGNVHERAWLVHILNERIQTGLQEKLPGTDPTLPGALNYYLFEERFRGTSESIRLQQLAFLPFFEKCMRVLDIGCGRGEFLEILRDHNIVGIGIDIDPDMVRYCRSHGLNVEQTEAIMYLDTVADNSLDGIFIDQVVEHLDPEYLVRMLAACYRKLRCGGTIVAETVNPLSLASFFNFYLDMSHHKPVHPLTLKFLLESVGFRDNEIKYYSPIPDSVKLQKIPIDARSPEAEQQSSNVCNSNIELLNNLLWGPRDYAIIGRK